MNYFISIIAAIFVIGLIIFLKPDSNNTNAAIQQELSSASHKETSKALDGSDHQSNSTTHPPQETPQVSTEQEELFDTKSDFSIQPIDPASDPGNQLPEDDPSIQQQ